APVSEPVSLIEAKAHLRVDHDDEDAAILRFIAAARECAESLTGRAFLQQDWILWCDGWPVCAPRAVTLPKPPLMTLTSVTAYDRSGAGSLLSSDAYIVDSAAAPGRLIFKDSAVLPCDVREAKGVAIAFRAGYGAAASDVPAGIRSA